VAIDGVLKRYLVPALMTLSVPASSGAKADVGERDTAPIRESQAAAQTVWSAGTGAHYAIGGEPARMNFGNVDLYVPTLFRPVEGTYDLVVHFHGISPLQERNVEQAGLNAVVVSVNLGISSDTYSSAFSSPGAFDALLKTTQRMMERTGRAPGARPGRIALSAWSAGFAAVGAVLKQPGAMDRIDAVLLADAPHVNYLGQHEVNDKALEKWSRFAQAAIRGEKLFALTHSSIPTVGYPSTTETVEELLKLTSLEKRPVAATGPRGMRPLYESTRGDCHVEGFDGRTAKDHIDHIKAMGETLLPYLRDFWSR
jgi:hypothetical protein